LYLDIDGQNYVLEYFCISFGFVLFMEGRSMTDSELMAAFDFTQEDLTYNRNGQFSPAQFARYKRSDNWARVFSWVVLLGSAAGTYFVLRPFFFDGLPIRGNLGRLIGGGLLAAVALLFLYAVFEKKDPVILTARGPAQFVSREHASQTGDQTSYSTSYYVDLAGTEIEIGHGKFSVFKQGHIYVIYREASIGILSVEYIGPPPD
jgi:hypothetical protein